LQKRLELLHLQALELIGGEVFQEIDKFLHFGKKIGQIPLFRG
jgi:hypothetical protein